MSDNPFNIGIRGSSASSIQAFRRFVATGNENDKNIVEEQIEKDTGVKIAELSEPQEHNENVLRLDKYIVR